MKTLSKLCHRPSIRAAALATLIAVALLAGAHSTSAERLTVRIGHFPNVTQAQGVIAHALSRQGKGWYEARLGPDVAVQWFTYNAGPSAMEAIFAGTVDLTYVGSAPALTAYFRSNGEEIRVIGGGATGGAALVVRADSNITTPGDFRGKRIATPQMGNTQDVACRAWLRAQGFKVTQTGGDVRVLPTANPDQLGLLQARAVDAVWTVEPWVTRLEREAKARVFLEDKAAITTWLVASVKFLGEQRELAQKIVAANHELTTWIQSHPSEAQQLLVNELKAETRTAVSAETIAQSLSRITLTTEVTPALLNKAVEEARRSGFLKGSADPAKLVEKP